MQANVRVLRIRDFRRLFLARTISLLGSGMAPIALAFSVLDLPGGNATVLGLTLSGRSIAQVVLLLFGGVLADRLPRFRLMVASDLVALAAQAAIAALVFARMPSAAALLALNMVAGAADALLYPASRAAVVDVVPTGDLQAANALLRLSRNATMIAGVTIGGLLVATVGGGWALAVNAVTFGVSAILLSGVRVAAPVRAAASSVLTDVRTGWQEFVSRRWIWLVVLQFAVINLCTTALTVLGPVTAKQRLGGPAAWAVISGAEAIGLVAGSVVAMSLRPRRPIRTAVLATFGFLPPFGLLAVGAPVWLIAAAMLVNGVCIDIFEVLWDTTMQRQVPPEALARISSYDAMASFALGPVGLILVGPVSSAYGTGRTLAAAGVIAALATVATFASRSVHEVRADKSDENASGDAPRGYTEGSVRDSNPVGGARGGDPVGGEAVAGEPTAT